MFIPNDLREELQKKAAASLQTLPSECICSGLRNELTSQTLNSRRRSKHITPLYLSTLATRRVLQPLVTPAGSTRRNPQRTGISTFCEDSRVCEQSATSDTCLIDYRFSFDQRESNSLSSGMETHPERQHRNCTRCFHKSELPGQLADLCHGLSSTFQNSC